jgi:peptidyl-prolyl cis-trans isomerase B (cyclophilin B)
VIALVSALSVSCGSEDPDEVAVLETTYGRIVIEFFVKDAPKHVANFKTLVRERSYEGTKFHRLVKIGNRDVAIQGGDPNSIIGHPDTWGQGNPNQRKVPAEFSRTLKHVRGIVSAARRGNDKDSATSQFFICTAANPTWDGEYSIFGRVIDGMSVVDTIVRAPIWPNTERPMDPVVVTSARLARRGEFAAAQVNH